MTAINVGLLVFLVLSILFFCVRAIQLNRQRALLVEVGEELDKSLATLKKTTAKKLPSPDVSDLLAEPALLATIVTVLIKKLGAVRLTSHDFETLDKASYVAVYVDVNTQDLVLALNDSDVPSSESSSSLMTDFFNTDSDDNTFH